MATATLGYTGLRDWLDQVEAMGMLRRVSGADSESEIGAAADVLQHTVDAPAALFDQIPGYDPSFRVLVNSFGSTDRIALTLGLPAGRPRAEVSDAWRQRIRDLVPVPPRVVSDGPVMTNIRRGGEVDMTIFPAPIWHPGDGGRYIGTGSFDLTRDPDDGWVNLGTYRVMLHDRRRLGYFISPGKHGRLHRQKYFDRDEPCPVAMVFGGDPLTFMASCTEVPYGVSEYSWVGAVRDRPVDVITGPVTGLPIPADAEIVAEGFATGKDVAPEGPFGEWTGYYASASREEPVMKVEALYYRDAPILAGSPPGRPPDELSRYRSILRSALLRDELDHMGLPNVTGAWQHEVGGSRLFTVVAIKQSYPGHTAQALHLAAQCHTAAYAGRWVIVVDDDIDPTNLEEVLWAVCTRADPATDIDIIARGWSTPLDPVIPPSRKKVGDYTSSRGLIDACRPWAWRNEFAPVNALTWDQRQQALQRWNYLLG
jgi:UbiD family decarboxylase